MAGADGEAATAWTGPGHVVGGSPVRLWGMSSTERLRRSIARVGGAAEGLVLNAAWVFDESLIKALAARQGDALVSDDGALVAAHPQPNDLAAAKDAVAAEDPSRLPAGFVQLAPSTLAPGYNAALRNRSPALLRRLSPEELPEIERRMFAGSYKGVTDLVTKYVWPAPALVVTRWCAERRITPNQVTFASFLLVLAAFALFWTGHFGWGLVCAWGMTFLDTVDGKLARVTLTSSKIGNAFDHGIDLVHPPFWWWAWIVGLAATGDALPRQDLVLAVVVGGYILQRMQEGLFIGLFKLEIHVWKRFDSVFRLITTRRNPNLIMLTVASLAGRPDLGMLAVAAWTVASVAVHGVRVGQAFWAVRRGPLTSWMED